MELGYIGLGAMGRALARRLMLSHQLRVLDVRQGLLEKFAEKGAIPAENGASLARECDVVLICLPRSENVREVIFGSGGLVEGLDRGKVKVVIDQTSGNPIETRMMAAELAEKGIIMIDAPVSPGPEAVEAGTITIMAGGPPETIELVKPIFESISSNLYYCGGIGNGQVLKLVNNILSSTCRLMTLEAVALGRKNGLSLETMTEVLNRSGGRNRFTEIMLPKMIKGEPSVNFAMGLMLKDVNLATQLGISCGVPMFLGNVTRGLLQAGVYKYGEDANLDDIAKLIESLTDTTFRE